MTTCLYRYAAFAFLLTFWPLAVYAVTPESPEVKRMVDRGIKFLEKIPGNSPGERMLSALAVLKAGRKDHPLIAGGIALAGTGEGADVSNNVYTISVAIILLSELNDQQHAKRLQELVDILAKCQKPHGGFGYILIPNGDVSQTQYAVLAMWSAKNAGAKMSDDMVINCCNWLLRVQDVGGGFPYHGTDPGHYNRSSQMQVPTSSVTVGGVGAVLILSDLMGVRSSGDAGAEQPAEEIGVSSALKVVVQPGGVEAPTKMDVAGKIDKQLIDNCIRDATKYLAANHKLPLSTWTSYYLYGVERCESFRSTYTRRKLKRDVPWYDQGVKYLQSQQAQDGSWNGDHSPSAATSLCLLFLVRSAEQAIVKKHKDLGEGVLTSGKGLPTDVANVSVKSGKVVDSKLAAEVDDIVALLDDPDNPELARLAEGNSDIKIKAEDLKRTGQITKLRAAVSAENWEARMVAVRAIGKSRDLDSVPTLLYAMTDPNLRVVMESDSALRFISRKFKGVGLPAEPTKPEIKKAREDWRKWYSSIRPDAQFID